jgi:thiamine biosynthesis lipoprotein
VDERRFHVMGTVAHVMADDAELIDLAVLQLDELEELWSRFRATSDVSRVNRSEGQPCMVQRSTATLIQLACDASRLTDGLFDPTVHDALVQAGYDRTFELLEDDSGAHPTTGSRTTAGPPIARGPHPCPGPLAIDLDRTEATVRLTAGAHLDLGGIGKGRAADLVVAALHGAGSRAVLVNLGGDLRVAGMHPDGGPWRVGVADPADPERMVCTLHLDSGAVATSTTAKRRWTKDGHEAHHLIDPRTGHPASSNLTSVTVIANNAVLADVLAKAALIAGEVDGLRLLHRLGVAALALNDAGEWLATAPLKDHLDAEGIVLVDEIVLVDVEAVSP